MSIATLFRKLAGPVFFSLSKYCCLFIRAYLGYDYDLSCRSLKMVHFCFSTTIACCVFFVFLLLSNSAFSQSFSLSPVVISSTGNFGKSNVGSISSTTGELVINTVSANAGILTQGFQQPEKKSVGTAVQEVVVDDFLITAYPNPATRNFYVTITAKDNQDFKLVVMDITGRKLEGHITHFVSGNKYEFQIDIGALAVGVYTVVVTNDNRFTKALKLEKLD